MLTLRYHVIAYHAPMLVVEKAYHEYCTPRPEHLSAKCVSGQRQGLWMLANRDGVTNPYSHSALFDSTPLLWWVVDLSVHFSEGVV